MNVRLACDRDAAFLAAHDQHISREELENALARRRVYLAEERGAPVGWLRFNLFWDNTPFCNLLFVSERNRGAGVGSALLGAWESDMRAAGYAAVMTSTQAEERAQEFYRARYAGLYIAEFFRDFDGLHRAFPASETLYYFQVHLARFV